MVVTHAGFSLLVPRNGNESHNASAPIYSRFPVYSSPVRARVQVRGRMGIPPRMKLGLPLQPVPAKARSGMTGTSAGVRPGAVLD